ncbi:MAG: putative glycerol-3-phosphate transporter subunit periplasmic-binding component of superfamily [Acidimicrobiales bacterium]|nr:putative glycerol-3-phosphate transporter subunit periplasmic-binding component of superfamily [Acidimicrobiales bacterium]
MTDASTSSREPVMTPASPARLRLRDARRWSGAVALTATCALVAAACGPPPSLGGTSAQSTAKTTAKSLPACPLAALAKTPGKVAVSLWYGGLGGATQATMEDMAKRFNASQSKVVVTANNEGASYDEVLRKYKGAAATPGQLPGVIYLEDTALGEMVDRGQVLPAESCMRAEHFDLNQILPGARASFSVNGVLWPGYINVSTPMIYINKVHFKKAGLDPEKPPRTLEEIYQDAKIIKAKGVASKPFVLSLKRWFFETWLGGIDEPLVNNGNGHLKPPTKAIFNTPDARKLLEFFVKMNREGLLNVFPNTPGKINHYLALISNPPESSMLIETSAAATTIKAALGGGITAKNGGLDLGVGGLDTKNLVPGGGALPGIRAPGKIHPSGGAFYILNTSSPATQAASWKFLQFMLRPDNAKRWYLVGSYQPILRATANEPDVQTFWQTDVAGVLLKPAYQQFVGADPKQPQPLIGPSQDFTPIIEKMLDSVLLSGADPANALARAQADATKLLQDYNGGH